LPASSGVPASNATLSGSSSWADATGVPSAPTLRTRWTAVPHVMKSRPITATSRTAFQQNDRLAPMFELGCSPVTAEAEAIRETTPAAA
jgi:hypothetical protein